MMKNVAAIGLGMLDGIGKPTGEDFKNAKAALFTKAAHEIVDLVAAWAAARETAFGLAGIGDQLVDLARRPQPSLRRAGGSRRAARRDPARPRSAWSHGGGGRLDPRRGPPGRRTPPRPAVPCGHPPGAVRWSRPARHPGGACDETTARPQPRDGTRPRHRGRRARRRPLGRAAATRTPPTPPPSTRCGSMIDSVSMDGMVVIGEGEKDEAPMLFNGEQVGNGAGPQSTSPSTRSTAPRSRRRASRTRWRSSRSPSAARCSSRAPRVYMEKIATGPEAADAIDIDAPRRGEHPRRSRRPRACGPRRSTVIDPRSPPPRGASSRQIREAGARVLPDHRRRRRRRDRRGHARAPGSTCCSASAARPRASSPPPRCKCLGGAIQGRL